MNMVRFLLSRGADPTFCDWNGMMMSALEKAASIGNVPALEAILDAGADLKTRGALFYAASSGNLDVIELLLSRGADINEIPSDELIVDKFHDQGLGTALCVAASKGETEAVKLLLKRGADPGIKHENGKSAMELAREKGHDDCVAILQGL